MYFSYFRPKQISFGRLSFDTGNLNCYHIQIFGVIGPVFMYVQEGVILVSYIYMTLYVVYTGMLTCYSVNPIQYMNSSNMKISAISAYRQSPISAYRHIGKNAISARP